MVPERKTLMKSAGLAAAAAGVGTAVGNSNYIIGIVLLLVGVLFFVYPGMWPVLNPLSISIFGG